MPLSDLETQRLAALTMTRWPRGRDYGSPIAHTCNFPHKVLNIDLTGSCYLCQCESWLPFSVGNILDFDRLEDVWASPVARELQANIDTQEFTYCAVKHCGILDRNIELAMFDVSINIDESCNLACPSCRPHAINHTQGPVFEERQRYINHMIRLIDQFDQPLKLTMSGNGDPLASLIMRPLVLNWQPKANQRIKLFTNGLLMKKLLSDSTIFKSIKEYQISVDAGSAQIYEQVRRPGKFSVLRENLDWLAANKDPEVHVNLPFCLQAANAMDLVNFANMCQHYGFRGHVVKLDNWGTWGNNFNQQDVIDNTDHPLHAAALEQLKLVKDHPNLSFNSYLKNLVSVA